MGVYPVRYRLPATYCTEIGRIVTRFAVVESMIRTCSYALLNVSPKQGRVAVRLGRVEDSLTALEDLVVLAGISVPTNIGALKAPLKKLEGWRDKLSHGVWVKHVQTSEPVLQITAGTYQDAETNSKAKARLEPRAAHVPLMTLRNWASHLSDAKNVIDKLRREIISAQKKALREKSRNLQAQGMRSGRRYKKKKAPQPQRRTSRDYRTPGTRARRQRNARV